MTADPTDRIDKAFCAAPPSDGSDDDRPAPSPAEGDDGEAIVIPAIPGFGARARGGESGSGEGSAVDSREALDRAFRELAEAVAGGKRR